jgi:transposase
MRIVGVDVAKVTLAGAQWRVEPVEQSVALGEYANTPAGWEALAQAVDAGAGAPTEPLLLVLEPTGGYEVGLALWATRRGWRVLRVNPYQVRQWAHSQGRRAKTDAQDAHLLTRYGVQALAAPTPPHYWQPLPSEVAELEQLLAWRDELAAQVQRERTREQQRTLHAQMPAAVPASARRLLRTLEEELETIERAIEEHLRQHDALQTARTRLLSVPGIGARNVLPILDLLARWQAATGGQGTRKGLVAFVGLDPQPYQSGTSVHRPATISRMGSRTLRAQLYMGALGALRGRNPAHSFYERLVARGKAKRLALVAASRKILVWAWAVFTSGQPFDAAKYADNTA